MLGHCRVGRTGAVPADITRWKRCKAGRAHPPCLSMPEIAPLLLPSARRRRLLALLAGAALPAMAATGPRQSVQIVFMASSAAQRSMLGRLFVDFERENADLRVTVVLDEQELYKSRMESRLVAPTPVGDILYWFGGAKLHAFVDKGWVEPISDVWAARDFDDTFTRASRLAVTVRDQVFALPISYYQWGMYYRKSLFARLRLKPPDTWEALLAACAALKADGVVPIALGSQDRWPVAAWFDHLNLRLNGLAFHKALMAGSVAYTDPRVREVFVQWRRLVDGGYLLPSHARADWRGALPYLYHGKAAMVLMGNFMVPQLPEGVREDVGYFRFPRLRPDLPFYEDAPIDVLLIPRNARNKAGAKRLIAYLGRPSVQQMMNDETGMISPNRMTVPGDDPFVRAGARQLAEADGIAQFYDRDTPPEMYKPGMEAFVRFLDQPAAIDEVLQALEAARRRAFR